MNFLNEYGVSEYDLPDYVGNPIYSSNSPNYFARQQAIKKQVDEELKSTNPFSVSNIKKRFKKDDIKRDVEDYYQGGEVGINKVEGFEDGKGEVSTTLILLMAIIIILYFIQFIQMQSINDGLKNLLLNQLAGLTAAPNKVT